MGEITITIGANTLRQLIEERITQELAELKLRLTNSILFDATHREQEKTPAESEEQRVYHPSEPTW